MVVLLREGDSIMRELQELIGFECGGPTIEELILGLFELE
jgi:hypothetical protein